MKFNLIYKYPSLVMARNFPTLPHPLPPGAPGGPPWHCVSSHASPPSCAHSYMSLGFIPYIHSNKYSLKSTS